MTAARLEELARQCKEWEAEMDITDEGLRADFSDLARCARAWAKVEKARRKGTWTFGFVWGFATLACGLEKGHETAIEAIEAIEAVEAVEAAEVKP